VFDLLHTLQQRVDISLFFGILCVMICCCIGKHIAASLQVVAKDDPVLSEEFLWFHLDHFQHEIKFNRKLSSLPRIFNQSNITISNKKEHVCMCSSQKLSKLLTWIFSSQHPTTKIVCYVYGLCMTVA